LQMLALPWSHLLPLPNHRHTLASSPAAPPSVTDARARPRAAWTRT
jgi:hypothetical protein